MPSRLIHHTSACNRTPDQGKLTFRARFASIDFRSVCKFEMVGNSQCVMRKKTLGTAGAQLSKYDMPGHFLKNPQFRKTNSIFEISKQLSATPFQNQMTQVPKSYSYRLVRFSKYSGPNSNEALRDPQIEVLESVRIAWNLSPNPPKTPLSRALQGFSGLHPPTLLFCTHQYSLLSRCPRDMLGAHNRRTMVSMSLLRRRTCPCDVDD